MNEQKSISKTTFDHLVLKYRIPEGNGPHPVILLFHGWTGDEDSMWVFSSKMPSDALLIAPRGLFVSTFGGFSWYRDSVGENPELRNFTEAIEAVHHIHESEDFSQGDFSKIRIVGFSQGAALAYLYALIYPMKVQSIAGLSGFVPLGVESIIETRPLHGLPVFVAHGSKDQMVPVERARQGVRTLENAGAQVTYCEDTVGHKLSASCYRSMQEFLRRN